MPPVLGPPGRPRRLFASVPGALGRRGALMRREPAAVVPVCQVKSGAALCLKVAPRRGVAAGGIIPVGLRWPPPQGTERDNPPEGERTPAVVGGASAGAAHAPSEKAPAFIPWFCGAFQLVPPGEVAALVGGGFSKGASGPPPPKPLCLRSVGGPAAARGRSFVLAAAAARGNALPPR